MRMYYFILLAMILVTISCDEPDNAPIEYKFEIINRTDKNIQIIAYKTEGNEVLNEIELNSSMKFSKSFFSKPSDRGYFYSDVLGSDSIKVIYGQEKYRLFYCFRNDNNRGCDEPRNILALFEDSDGDRNNGIILNSYIFTENDYENAIPCNDDCE